MALHVLTDGDVKLGGGVMTLNGAVVAKRKAVKHGRWAMSQRRHMTRPSA